MVKNFSNNVEKQSLKDNRVLVVEQTETQDQLEQCREQTSIKDKGVKRFMLGQFSDDSARRHLCSMRFEIRPVELIKSCGILSDETETTLRNQVGKPWLIIWFLAQSFGMQKCPIFEIKKLYALINGKLNSRSTTANDAKCVSNHTDGVDHGVGSPLDVICHVVNAGANGHLALSTYGDFGFIQDATLKSNQVVLSWDPSSIEPYMILDATTLENLEILVDNHNGSSLGALLALVDHCAITFGQRLCSLKDYIIEAEVILNIVELLEVILRNDLPKNHCAWSPLRNALVQFPHSYIVLKACGIVLTAPKILSKIWHTESQFPFSYLRHNFIPPIIYSYMSSKIA
eukprot:Gb_22228 [translate_table: standard]